jgi:hypothetical protein
MKWASWVVVVAVAGSMAACGDSAAPDDVDENVATAQAGLMKGTPGAKVGDDNYCDDPANLCGLGEGDCDATAQCQSTLTCVPGNLAKRGALSGDACAPLHCGNGFKDLDETSIDCGGTCGWDCTVTCNQPNGGMSKCSSDCPLQRG